MEVRDGKATAARLGILLNSWGRIAEATASCVLMVKDGGIVTPPPHEGCLESITVNLLEHIANDAHIRFERRPIDRSELMLADELALAGTLMEVGIIQALDSREMPHANPRAR